MDMLLHGVKDTQFEIYHGHTLTNDWDMLREMNPAKMPTTTPTAKQFSPIWAGQGLGTASGVFEPVLLPRTATNLCRCDLRNLKTVQYP